MCTEAGAGEEFTPHFRDMVFVVDLTMYGAIPLSALIDAMPPIHRDNINHHPDWIINYMLAGYNSTCILYKNTNNDSEVFSRNFLMKFSGKKK